MTKSVLATLALGLIGSALLCPPAAAQTPTRDEVLTEAFQDVGRQAAGSIVRVHVRGSPAGYGAVVDRGWVVTTERLVRGTGAVDLETSDGDIVRARVIGRDGLHDLALLAIDGDASNLPAMNPGGPARVGQWVVSAGIGDRPLAVGVVSAVERDVDSDRKNPGIGLYFMSPGFRTPMREYRGVIQHDSPLEEGEMGSPIVDTQGLMIGINVGRPYRSTTYATPMADITAALPGLKAGQVTPPLPDIEPRSDIFNPFEDLGESVEGLRRFLDDLFSGEGMGELFEGFRERLKEFLGEQGADEFMEGIEEMLKGFFGEDGMGRPPEPVPPPAPGSLGIWVIPKPVPDGGFEVESVTPGSAGGRAGIEVGDVITAVDGQAVESYGDLKELVSGKTEGTEIEITYRRPQSGDRVDRTVRVTLGARPVPAR